MAFVKEEQINVGDWCVTTKELENFKGKFEIGTPVKVTGYSSRGYDLVDEFGNEMLETGFDSIRKTQNKIDTEKLSYLYGTKIGIESVLTACEKVAEMNNGKITIEMIRIMLAESLSCIDKQINENDGGTDMLKNLAKMSTKSTEL